MAGLTLLCGIASEPPLRRVAQAFEACGHRAVVLDQRDFPRHHLQVQIDDGGARGELSLDGTVLPLEEFCGVYTRVTDWRILPQIESLSKDDPQVEHCQAFHEHLLSWYESAPIRVLNRSAAMASNGSKPYQAQLIRAAGFAIAPTLVTNRPAHAQAFLHEHGRVVFKAISGERTIVTEVDGKHLSAFERLPRCPTQFQRYVAGTDVRVHVVGQQTFATEVRSRATDYRYDRGEGARLRATTLDPDLARRCVELAHHLDLYLAGIDLRFGEDGRVYCFEVNPSPAFSYYEEATGQPIAQSIAHFLATGDAR